MQIIHAALAVLCALWLLQSLVWWRNAGRLGALRSVAPLRPHSWPSLSIVIPARDEAASIEAALRSRLDDDYPDFEVVVVDDRSSDGTSEIVSRLEHEDERVTYIRVDELPEGWLGKVHAMRVGWEASRGEWVLLSDADVHVEPGAMRLAVGHCLANELDLLALIPEYRTHSWLVDALWAVFLRVFCIMLDPKAVRDPDSPLAIGSGAFNLVRRKAFEDTRGFEWLRLETTDDMALGQMMKQAGKRCDALDGRGTASVLIYRDLREFFHGTEKNAGVLLGAPAWVTSISFTLWLLVEWAPLIALVVGPAWLRALGLAATLAAFGINVGSIRLNTGRVGPGLLWPVGSLLFAVALIRASWRAKRLGGVHWRGTFYSRELLLAHRRFEFRRGGFTTVSEGDARR